MNGQRRPLFTLLLILGMTAAVAAWLTLRFGGAGKTNSGETAPTTATKPAPGPAATPARDPATTGSSGKMAARSAGGLSSAGGKILFREEHFHKEDKAVKRIVIFQPDDLPWPVRVEEKLRRGPSGKEELVLSRREMVATHLLLKPARGEAGPDLRARAAALGARLRPHPSAENLYFLEFENGGEDRLPAILKAMRGTEGLVRYVEPDYIVRALQVFPDDPRFNELWGLHNTGQNGGTSDADMDAPEGWEVRHDAGGVIVAIIDTGVRLTHEDLAANLWINPGEIAGNGIDDDGNGYVDDLSGFNAITGSGNPIDDNGHGTHVAGIIGAVGNNGVGGTGVAWNTRLMALKFLDADGSGAVSDAIESIDYGIAKGADLMNNSWGGGGFSLALFEAIENARQAGIIFVAAAGNEAADNDSAPTFPASFSNDNIVAVASMNRRESLSSFSNFGERSVDLAAPGEGILSLANTGDSAYRTLSGTSMATPQITGLLALLKAEFPAENFLDLINRLYGGADPVEAYRGKMRTGRRANLDGALRLGAVLDYPRITHAVGNPIVADGQNVAFTVEAAGTSPFSYRWFKDGLEIAGAAGNSLSLANVSENEGGEYRVVVGNAAGETTSTGFLEVGTADPALGEAVDAPALTWVTSGDALWRVDTGQSRSGGDSALSGDIDDNQRTRLSATVTGPGTIAFSWKVSSEAGWDFLTFLIGGQLADAISGEADWQEKSFAVPAGFQTLEWTYFKDTSVSDGEDAGRVDKVLFTVNGVAPPVILEEPQNIAVLEGGEAFFSVAVSGTGPFAFQWKKEGGALGIPTADTDTLTLTGVGFEDVGLYSVTVRNAAGSVTSLPALLTVDTTVRTPFITGQPRSQSVDAGETVTFSVRAGGTYPFQYQWRKDGADIPGAAGPSLVLAEVGIEDEGFYAVAVSNSAGADVSDPAELSVFDANLAPVIGKNPVATAAFRGEPVSFTVEAMGEGQLRFQWRRDVLDLTLPTAQSATLDLVGVQLAESGNYSVVVSNDFGSATSNPALLTVLAPDPTLSEGVDAANLTFGTTGDAPWFNQSAVSLEGADALQSGNINDRESSDLIAIVQGPGFLSFQRQVSSELGWDFLRFFLDDELIDEISGLTTWAEVRLLVPAGRHILRWTYEKDPVFSFGADAGWVDEVLYVPADVEAPFITADPQNRSAVEGEAVILTVGVFGREPLSFQWEKDGAPVTGATTDSLDFPAVGFGDAGSYRVAIGNAFGSATSETAVLDVFSSDPIGDALDFPGQTWTNDGNAFWFAQSPVSHDGVDAMQSPPLADQQSSGFSTQISGPVDLSFWWKSSTEDFFDPLEVSLDGQPVAKLSGEHDWHRQFLRLRNGLHTVRWVYAKDQLVFDGLDTVWVDELEAFDADAYLNGALESANLVWSARGPSWFAETATTYDGEDALQSGPISHEGETVLETTVNGPGVLSFQWKVSSEAGFDLLSFALDGVVQSSLSGFVDWQKKIFMIGEGFHTLTWTYRKDQASSSGADAAWLDKVSFSGNHPPKIADFTLAGVEDTPLQLSEADFSAVFSDPDAGDSLSLIRVTALPANGTLTRGGMAVVPNADIPATALDSLVFNPAPDFNGGTGFDWTAGDGKAFSETTARVTFLLEAVNDAPVLEFPGGIVAGAGFDVPVSGMSLSDADAGSASLTLTLTVNAGVLTLGETVPNGLVAAQISGNQTGNVTVHAPLADLNATLADPAGLRYRGNPGFIGDDLLALTANDNGNAGTGGPREAGGSVPISVTGNRIEDWRRAHFAANDLADANLESSLWGDGANPDGDRLPNLIEFFMALNPALRDDSDAFLLSLNGPDLVFIYRKSKTALGVAGTVEWSADLKTWSAAGISETIVRDEPEATLIEARLPAGAPARFVRLRVERGN